MSKLISQAFRISTFRSPNKAKGPDPAAVAAQRLQAKSEAELRAELQTERSGGQAVGRARRRGRQLLQFATAVDPSKVGG